MSLALPPSTLPSKPAVLTLPQGLRLLRFYRPARGNWSAHRFYGPLPEMRFDHHEPPCSVDPTRSVWYASTSLRGAVAETFGRGGIVDPASGIRLVKVEVGGELRVLNLIGVSARAMGLTQEIATTTDYAASQAWARAFYDQYPTIQGIRWRGRQIGSVCVVLNDRAAMDALSPELDSDLTDPRIWPRVVRAVRDCGFTVI
ncbi:MAG: RES family NAD+ phosphorylase [bacterium]|nr:RES family NAD+ phosphorylase [bacterium]